MVGVKSYFRHNQIFPPIIISFNDPCNAFPLFVPPVGLLTRLFKLIFPMAPLKMLRFWVLLKGGCITFFFSLCCVVRVDFSEQRAGAQPGAPSRASVRLVLRCIVGQLVGCYGDLAVSMQGVHELLLSPRSLGRLVI